MIPTRTPNSASRFRTPQRSINSRRKESTAVMRTPVVGRGILGGEGVNEHLTAGVRTQLVEARRPLAAADVRTLAGSRCVQGRSREGLPQHSGLSNQERVSDIAHGTEAGTMRLATNSGRHICLLPLPIATSHPATTSMWQTVAVFCKLSHLPRGVWLQWAAVMLEMHHRLRSSCCCHCGRPLPSESLTCPGGGYSPWTAAWLQVCQGKLSR